MMAVLPRFIEEAHIARDDAAFRSWAAEIAGDYVRRKRIERANRAHTRRLLVACGAVAVAAAFTAWNLSVLITWLLNN